MTSTRIAHPFQDPGLAIERRVEDLLSRMDRNDKAGLVFHTMAFAGDPEGPNRLTQGPSVAELVRSRRITHFNVMGALDTGRAFAEWTNAVQAIAAEHPLGIPVTLSTDPRHAFSDNPATSVFAGPFSQWPESLGLAALNSPERVQRFADVVRQEYLAVGIRAALHPQVDLATEPRWCRAGMTFGEDADLTSRLVVAYLRGLQGDGEFGAQSVSGVVKHFPGGGPQRDGADPHFADGKEQVYPGGRFEYHLEPFVAAIGAGARQMMPYYGVPIGTEFEEVGFGFNRGVVTGLLRERLGFDGIVLSDWGLLTDEVLMGAPMAARAWGVEHLSVPERMALVLHAGVDQFGGEHCTDVLLGLLDTEAVTEDRIDASARRILREKFALGLFDRPLVVAEDADLVVGSSGFVAEGLQAQRDSLTLLVNDAAGEQASLPLAAGLRVYCEGLDPRALRTSGVPVDTPEAADVAVIRLGAPYETRGKGLRALFHEGSLEFPAEVVEHVAEICAAVPTVVVVHVDRPPVLTPIAEVASALLVDYGCRDDALVDVMFGNGEPRGVLPFDLPRSMGAVEASRSDTPFDSADPLFRCGFGLRYGESAAAGGI